MSKPINVLRQDHYKEIQSTHTRPYFETLEYLEYRRMWTECPDRQIVPDTPINLDIHVTNKCNLKCPFCPRTWMDLSGSYDDYGFMTWELYKKIADEALAKGARAFHFTADGEPLLHRGLEDMIKYANDNGVMEVIVHTNACGLSGKRSRSLLEAGMTRLAVSFDSPVKETYEKIRIGANFDKTLANIRRFVALRDELGYELPTVRVQMVKQEMNVGQVEMFDELFGEFVDSTSHVDYVNYNGGPNAYVDQDVIDGDKMSHTLRVLNPDFICKYLWQRLIIQWDGKCYPCFYGFDLVVGDLNNQSLDEIWHGEKMQELRELHSTGKYNACDQCANCGRQYETVEEDIASTADVI